MRGNQDLDGNRLRALRELKDIRTQQALADLVGVPQSHISDLEKGKLRNPNVFVRVADKLDCTTDFLFRRGPFRDADSPKDFRAAASKMAFDSFASNPKTGPRRRGFCARVVGHRAAPLTAAGWAALAEQIDLAIGPTEGGTKYRSIAGGKT
jgi:transcriptional regulator with XRE-family HTH domain